LVVTTGSGNAYVLLNSCSTSAPPTILEQPIDHSVQEGQDTSFSVKATALLPVAYQWLYNGRAIQGATNDTLLLSVVTGPQSGSYSVLVSTSSQSIASHAAELDVRPLRSASGVVSQAHESTLRSVLQTAQTVTFNVDGAIALSAPVLITDSTTLDGTGHNVALDGQGAVSHFVVTNGASLRLVNLRLINGRAQGTQGATNVPGNPGMGGSILNYGGRVDLVGCTFVNNQAAGGPGGVPFLFPPSGTLPTTGGGGFGGAICSWAGQLSVTDCLFTNNAAWGGVGHGGQTPATVLPTGGPGGDSSGGAIFGSNAVVAIQRSTLTGNLVHAGEAAPGVPPAVGGASMGGALATTSCTTLVTNCVFTANQAVGPNGGNASGGALFLNGGSAVLSQALFQSNSVTGGGAIYYGPLGGQIAASGYGGAVLNTGAWVSIQASSFIANQAIAGGMRTTILIPPVISGVGAGGGIYNQNHGTLLLVNCTLANNSAVGAGNAWGGAVVNDAATASLLNATLDGNSFVIDPTIVGSVQAIGLGSSLLTTNNGTTLLTNSILFATAGQTNVSGQVSDGGHNISSDASGAFTAASSRNSTDPLLGTLGFYGGPTPTIPLQPGSPAVDAADTAAGPATDQRGVTRPVGAASDIGAFELTPTLTLARSADGSVRVDYTFRPNQPHQVAVSTNLVDWLPLDTGSSNANGFWEFLDPSAPGPYRFYRVQ
jgi:hypothetical protein